MYHFFTPFAAESFRACFDIKDTKTGSDGRSSCQFFNRSRTLFIFTRLIRHRTRSFAGRLARRLAFAAAAMRNCIL
jgi:hypothetical protein